MTLDGFDADTRGGILYTTEWIQNQAVIRGITLSSLEWSPYSGDALHVAEVRIESNGEEADQLFTADQLVHCQPGEQRTYDAFFEVAVKVDSLFLRLER